MAADTYVHGEHLKAAHSRPDPRWTVETEAAVADAINDAAGNWIMNAPSEPHDDPNWRGAVLEARAALGFLAEADLLIEPCSTCGGTGTLKCLAHQAADGCDEGLILCPDCRSESRVPGPIAEEIAALRRDRQWEMDRANEAARLSAQARDDADHLRRQIEDLNEHVAGIESDRTEQDAWAVRVAMKHNADYAARLDLDPYEAIEKSLTAVAEAEARGYQRAIDALRAAIYSLSEADDMHNGEDFGPDKCLGCRWRLRLADEVKRVEASAQTAIRSGESTDE